MFTPCIYLRASTPGTARTASASLARLDAATRDAALREAAKTLRRDAAAILAANAADLAAFDLAGRA